jgi:hypothetical protein
LNTFEFEPREENELKIEEGDRSSGFWGLWKAVISAKRADIFSSFSLSVKAYGNTKQEAINELTKNLEFVQAAISANHDISPQRKHSGGFRMLPDQINAAPITFKGEDEGSLIVIGGLSDGIILGLNNGSQKVFARVNVAEARAIANVLIESAAELALTELEGEKD